MAENAYVLPHPSMQNICPFCGVPPVVEKTKTVCNHCSYIFPQKVGEDVGLEIDPEKAKKLLDSGKAQLIDVRNKNEYDIVHLPNAKLMPMSEFPKNFKQIDSKKEAVLCCKKGMRCFHATRFLKQKGYKKIHSMKGGIEGYKEKIDPSLPGY